MDITVPFHVCWNAWGPVHSSILFWNIPSTSMLPSWFCQNGPPQLTRHGICLRSPTFYYYGTLNLDWIMYIVHVSYLWASFFSEVLWESLCLNLPPRALVPIKPASSGFYPSCKALLHNFWCIIWRVHYQCWADIRFFQYPLVLAIRPFIIHLFQLLLLFLKKLLLIACNNIKK